MLQNGITVRVKYERGGDERTGRGYGSCRGS
jgi:hypothetical protein